MPNNNDLTGLVNMNLGLMEDEASRLIYLSQVYYNITGDYSYIGKMLKGLWYDHREVFTSADFKKIMERCLPDIDNMKPVSHFTTDSGTMFFDPGVISLGDDEVFCDCGALEMGTSLEFVFLTKDRFKKIYAFEPDPLYAEMCRANLSMFSPEVRDNIFIFNIGLDEANGTRPFEHSKVPGNSRIIDTGEEKISVKKLDDIPECQDITFMKIHTEGTEFSCIKGAAGLIKRNKPVIAVSLYHNLKELINVPLLLHGLVPEYKFFMRHYSNGTSESVLYAVRKEIRK